MSLGHEFYVEPNIKNTGIIKSLEKISFYGFHFSRPGFLDLVVLPTSSLKTRKNF